MKNRLSEIALLICCTILLGFAHPTSASEFSHVLILNSDMSVRGKYMSVQTNFIATLPIPSQNIKAIDLGPKWRKTSSVLDEIRQFHPDIIYCIGSEAYILAQEIAPSNIILFSSIINWNRLPMSENTYGIANEIPYREQLNIFKTLLPDVETIGVLYSEKYNGETMQSIRKNAKLYNFKIREIRVKQKGGTQTALKKSLADIDCLWILPDPQAVSSFNDVTAIFQMSRDKQKPVFAYSRGFIKQGALIAIEPDPADIGRQAAVLAMKLINKKTVAERIKSPLNKIIDINGGVAEQYGLNLSNTPRGKLRGLSTNEIYSTNITGKQESVKQNIFSFKKDKTKLNIVQ